MKGLVVAGTGFIFPRCFEMGKKRKQPKETPIALQSDFLFFFKTMRASLDPKIKTP